MKSIELTLREKICGFTYFLTPKLNFSACSKITWRKVVFWTMSPGLQVACSGPSPSLFLHKAKYDAVDRDRGKQKRRMQKH